MIAHQDQSRTDEDELSLAFLDLVACAVLASALLRQGRGWSIVQDDAPDGVAAKNAERAHRLEFDGYHPMAMGHPATVVLPALLAVWEATGSGTGRDLAHAFSLGMEAAVRLAGMVGPAMVQAGLHPTAELGRMAAGVACRDLRQGRMLLSVREAITEFGRHPRSDRADFGTAEKARRVGEAAGEAVALVLGSRENDPIQAIASYRELGLSEDALAMELRQARRVGVRTVFKPMPACGYLLPTLAITSALRSEARARGGLTRLELTVPESVARDAGPQVPSTLDEARFSLSFLAWLVLDDDYPSRCLLSERRFSDALARFKQTGITGYPLVQCHPDGSVKVTAQAADGTRLSSSGDPRNALQSLNRLGVERKLRMALDAALRPASAADEIIGMAGEWPAVTASDYTRVVRSALYGAGAA